MNNSKLSRMLRGIDLYGMTEAFSDDVDDVIINDVTDKKLFSAANEPDIGFRRKLVQIKVRLRVYRSRERF